MRRDSPRYGNFPKRQKSRERPWNRASPAFGKLWEHVGKYRVDLHGKKIQIIEPDDPAHYFYGRVSIKETSNILPYATIELEATCEPWRYHRNVTVRRVDVNSSDITEAVISNNGVKTLCPEITVTGNIKLHYNGSEIPLAKGTYKIREIRLKSGVNLIGVSGAGSVSFLYREADI